MAFTKAQKRQDAMDGMIVAHGDTVMVSADLTLSSTDALATGDYVGTSGTPITFTNCARENGLTGIIAGAILIDKAAQSVSAELWLFDTAVTPPANSAAWTISDDDAAHCIGVIPFSTYYASALNSVSPAGPMCITFVCGAATRNLYGCLVTRGAPVYEPAPTIVLRILQD